MLPDRLRSSAGPGALAIARYGHADRVVVCLHGFPLSSFSWRHVAPVLARAGWTVVCPDLLGAGESDRPLDASLTPTAQARWVREALAALGVTRAVLVGHDAGALVACHLAIGAPELVHALALVSPVVPGA
ncbi:MAG: alpha/beta hydrolase, partial [Gemmatimonadetes bacterium]|nr:alpha/beta hydrolase [Gemmatimonadota bacterium]